MQEAYGLQAYDGSVLVVAKDKETLEEMIAEEPVYGLATEIIQLQVNMEPLSEEGKEILKEVERTIREKNIVNFRYDKQASWYAMSADERAKHALELLTLEDCDTCEPLEFGDTD